MKPNNFNIEEIADVVNDLNNLVNAVTAMSAVMKLECTGNISEIRTRVVDWMRDCRDECVKFKDENEELHKRLEFNNNHIQNLLEKVRDAERKVEIVTSPDNVEANAKKLLLEKETELQEMQEKVDAAFKILSELTSVGHEVFEEDY